MPDQVPRPVVQERYDRLAALVSQIAEEENAKQDGATVEVLVAEGEGRKGRRDGTAFGSRALGTTARCNFAPHDTSPRPGRDIVTTRVTSTAPHLPARRRCPAERPPHPRGRRLGGPPASRRARDRCRSPVARPRRSCSACRPAAASPPASAMTPSIAGRRLDRGFGKSDLAVDLALALDGEVINADSMQLYRGMDIGTAKLTVAQRRGVPHHLLDVWDVTEAASVAEFQDLADAVITDVTARGKVPVLVGGSGLYIRAALGELDFPGTDEV